MNLTKIPFQGASMNPIFKDASHVLVDFFEEPGAWPAGSVLGDVVLYKQNGEWVCHRCIGISDDTPLFKGDYNTSFEKNSSVVVWGVVRGYVKDQIAYRSDYFFALSWLCYFQRRQCETRSYLYKKIHRAASLLLLAFNKRFFTRKYNQPAS